MELRWLIIDTEVTTWDDREDDWVTHSFEGDPVLQMKVDGKWVTVPTVRRKRNQKED